MSKIIKTLKTERQTWSDVTLFTSTEEARKSGYSLMYGDEKGTIFGIRDMSNMHSWESIGFVPYRGYYDDYLRMAEDIDPSGKFKEGFMKQYGNISVTVCGGSMEDKEVQAYIDRAKKLFPDKRITAMTLSIADKENVDIEYHYDTVPFQRIRRVTGYLAGTLDRFNSAKQAEVRDRVKHDVPQQEFEDVYINNETNETGMEMEM